MNPELCKGNYKKLGRNMNGDVTTFSVHNKERKECILLLYQKNGNEPLRIPMQEDPNQTFVYSVGVKGLPSQGYEYIFELAGEQVLDPYATCIWGREQWGTKRPKESNIRCRVKQDEPYNWGTDRMPGILKQDMIMYKLHVRGFSMLAELEEREKGTFKGIERKLSYLKELGITTLEFMPIYEFEEIFAKDTYLHERFPEDKINYWGYTRGNYFAVKSSYLGAGKTEIELKQLIHKIHENGMECILEFYFDNKLSSHYVLDVLRYWAEEYHVDGFHVICDAKTAEFVANDYRLGGRKLFYDWFSDEQCEKDRHEMQLFSYNDGFLYGVRKLMNHKTGSVRDFTDQMRRQHMQQGFVNYLASNNGFCLYDIFSYKQKRNLANGEDNHDGVVWNFSTNCGEEGPSKKKCVNQLRLKQIKNALCALMFAQGVPLLWMGDECGNSQNGNNNAYCQDNATGWKSWDNEKWNRDIISFCQELVVLRKQFSILRKATPMEFSDNNRTGFPDLSYHGKTGWLLHIEDDSRTIGLLYSCSYQEEAKETEDALIYVGYNFERRERTLALPVLPPEYRWYYIMDTGQEDIFFREEKKVLGPNVRTFEIQKQSICVLAARREA